MPPVSNRMLSLLSLLSLVLIVVLAALWAQSYRRGYWLTWHPLDSEPRLLPMGKVMVCVGKGGVGVGSITYSLVPDTPFDPATPPEWAWGSTDPADPGPVDGPDAWNWGGFGFAGKHMATHIHDWRWQAYFPLWALCALFAIGPGAVVLRRLRANRGRVGICRRCGYDLRATPDRCPECGTEPPPAPSR